MKKTTKIVIAVAVAAAIVFPGAAALAKGSETVSPKPKTSVIKDKTDGLRTCRENNRAVLAEFLKANKTAEISRNQAMAQANKDFKAAIKAAGDDQAAKDAAVAARKAAIKAAQDAFAKAKQSALDARKKNSKKCVVDASVNTSSSSSN